MARECETAVKCRECNSDRHVSAMHPGPAPWAEGAPVTEQEQGGESEGDVSSEVTSKCTEICGKAPRPKSCSKICLVDVFPSDCPEQSERMYVVLDDQSNRSLAKSAFFKLFGINGDLYPYTLHTCAGTSKAMGRRADNFIVRSLDGETQVSLPTLLECNMLPEDRDEIPTPEIARYFSHLEPVADKLPPFDTSAPILLLLGRDILSVHKVREQYNGPGNMPFAQRLDLGWVIVGEVCMGGVHKSETANVFRTNILQNGRTSFFPSCSKGIQVKEQFSTPIRQCQSTLPCYPITSFCADHLGDNVFQKTPSDDKLSLSVEDGIFLDIMNREMYMDESNHWVAPLPFRLPHNPLPNNRDQAMKRLNVLQRTLQRKPEMAKHFVEFMHNMFINKHAEIAPPLQPEEECWYLPIFGVYHPMKPGKIRVVFDSSAQCVGISLNDTLLCGPDLNNRLIGVLVRFRKEQVAVTTDVEQMFYCFKVREDHQNFLRFLWFKDNDLSKEITEYRMTVHVFGNSPSPAVAIFGIRRAAEFGEEEYGRQAKQFVHRHFYVDDGLISVSSAAEAISLLKNTKNLLAESNIKLHKISSNNHQVMEAFPTSDRANDLKDLDLSVDPLPLQRSLGVSWCLETDCFMFQVSSDVRSFTHVGLDVFGPWSITSRRTRGGSADSKRWVVIFSCLSTRAVHLEVIESMSTSSFINALRRFLAVCGPVKHFRSDRGTNFIGACRELNINTDDPELKGYLQEQGCTWSFNAPHSSHMGGAWERMINTARRILDALLLKNSLSRLTHEVLTTLMSEVMAIMNARPLLPISSDPDTLEVLSPSMLLTQKASTVPAPLGDFDMKDLYKKEWRQVQCLADAFWKAWRRDYLATLQIRRKWTEEKRNLQEGDVVLLKDSNVKRNEWPIGLIVKTIPSSDNRVRKVEVKIIKEGSAKVYLRPISEVVLLLPGKS